MLVRCSAQCTDRITPPPPPPPPPPTPCDNDVDMGVVSIPIATNCSSPSAGGTTSDGTRAMRSMDGNRCVVIVFVTCVLESSNVASSWIYDGISNNELENAKEIGRKAKVDYVNKVIGETNHLKRNSHYLDGLEKCNNIDREWTDHIQEEAIRYGNVENAVWLQKAGMKEFTALFLTLPPYHMTRIANAACAKHEKQLTCGAEFEGFEVTQKRISDLKKIGNHKMMFEKECKDTDFVIRVYPCVGRDVSNWIRPCAEHLNAYSSVRDSVNQRISTIYDNAVQRVKSSSDGNVSDEKLNTFEKAMTSIAILEGSKCGLFKKMRVCVLRQLLDACGVEAVKAFNVSISLGYLRTERREQLNLDFEVFNYPIHPNCVGL